jgi:hypothetical protein
LQALMERRVLPAGNGMLSNRRFIKPSIV